jgi:hypothetical protein
MSSRNGERARFHLQQRRKRNHRQRLRELLAARTRSPETPSPHEHTMAEPPGERIAPPPRRTRGAKR